MYFRKNSKCTLICTICIILKILGHLRGQRIYQATLNKHTLFRGTIVRLTYITILKCGCGKHKTENSAMFYDRLSYGRNS